MGRFGILAGVKSVRLSPLVILCLAVAPLILLATSGTFRGTLIDPPSGDNFGKVVYVKARNGMVRKVDISGAVVVYEGSVPQAKREARPSTALKSGVEVRVTAEQGETGDWKATQVEIVGPEEEHKPVERERPSRLSDDRAVT